MRGIPIDHRACVTADHAIGGIIGVDMRIPRGGAARGRRSTVIGSQRRSSIASPGETAQGIITEGLGVGDAASGCGGHRGGGLQHIAHIIQGARQAPQGCTGSGDGGAAADGSQDTIIAERGAEHGRWDAGFGRTPANVQPGELTRVGVIDLSAQERDGIAAIRVPKVQRAQIACVVIIGTEDLSIGIGQAGHCARVVVAHQRGLRGGLAIGGYREAAVRGLSTCIVAITAPAISDSIAECFDGRSSHGIATAGRGTTGGRERLVGVTAVAIPIVEVRRVRAALAGGDLIGCCATTERTIQHIVAGVGAHIARIGLAEHIAIAVIGITPCSVRTVATGRRHRGQITGSQVAIVVARPALQAIIGRICACQSCRGTIIGHHRCDIAHLVVVVLHRSHDTIRTARSIKDLFIAVTPQPIGILHRLVPIGIQGDGLLKGRARVDVETGNTRRNRIGDCRLSEDLRVGSIGDAAQGPTQAIIARRRAGLIAIRGHIRVARIGNGIGQALIGRTPQIIIDGIGHQHRGRCVGSRCLGLD